MGDAHGPVSGVSKYSKRQPRYTPVRGRRGEFATVERRRREYLGDARPRPVAPLRGTRPKVAASDRLARAAATAVIASTSLTLCFGLILTLGAPQPPPYLATHPNSAKARQVARNSHAVANRAPATSVVTVLAPLVVAIENQPLHERARVATAQRARIASSVVAGSRARASTSIVPGAVNALAGSQARAHPIVASAFHERAPKLTARNGGFAIEAQPWRLTADGTWVADVVTSYADDAGVPQPHLRAEVTFDTSNGEAVALDPWINQSPAAQITTSAPQSVTVTATSIDPANGAATLTLPAPPTDAASFASVARAIGPHLAVVGWTPLASSAGIAQYKVYRHAQDAAGDELIAVVSPGGHSWRDTHVQPNASYDYSVVAEKADQSLTARAQSITTPDVMPDTELATIAGKGMFLFFSPDTSDRHSYARVSPDAVIAQAGKAGVTEIELRLSRGTFFEAADPNARAWLDRFIDTASAAGIRLVAWSVPQRNSAEDVAESIMMARYRTPAGNGFAGLALDLEPGVNYMGYGAVASERIADYVEMAREAVGPNYLLIATVISPSLTRFTNDNYPYSRIARYASALQPMEYWHHFRSSHQYAQADVSAGCAQAVALTKSLAGRAVPINVAGQSTDLGSTGSPAPDELSWCLGGAKSAGAIGEMFFDWQGTTADQWAAIEAYRW